MSYSPISSLAATRDLVFDATNALEDGEVITTADVTTSIGTVVCSNVQVNVAEVAVGSKTIAIGKGVLFTVTVTAAEPATYSLYIDFEGDGGSKDRYEEPLEVVDYL